LQRYNEDLHMWMRIYLYYCETKVPADVGPLIKHPSNYTLDSGGAVTSSRIQLTHSLKGTWFQLVPLQRVCTVGAV
jgi:hypothetical protein